MLNSQLGDDSSPTDRLVIDGGSASGDTGLRVINAGGEGAYTTHGIRLVQTINGATTAADAFHLDAGSTGYRASADTLALNGYDYSLVRGGNDGVADDWYLTSSDAPPPGPIDPSDPVDPADPADPTDPALPCLRQKARATGTSRRKAVPGPATGAPPCACSRTACATATPAPPTPMRAAPGARWTRIHGGHDSGLRMAEGRVDIETDSAMAQLGVDLLRAPLGADAALRIGLMAGYGDAHALDFHAAPARRAGKDTSARHRLGFRLCRRPVRHRMPMTLRAWAPMPMPGCNTGAMTTASAVNWAPRAMAPASGPPRWKPAMPSSLSRPVRRWPISWWNPRRSSSTAATRPKMPRCKACACATVRAAIP